MTDRRCPCCGELYQARAHAPGQYRIEFWRDRGVDLCVDQTGHEPVYYKHSSAEPRRRVYLPDGRRLP